METNRPASNGQTAKHTTKKDITYETYLQVPTLLSCQKPLSTVPEEGLFILVHQAFELWFKQALTDIDNVRHLLQKPEPRLVMVDVIKMLERILMIFKLVVQQFAILETMPPMEFMNFRFFLSTASGFQSAQFRLLEIKLGVKEDTRLEYAGQKYTAAMDEDSVKRLEAAKQEPSLLERVGRWLETIPGPDDTEFNFVNNFREHVKRWQAHCGKDYSESGFEDILDESRYHTELKRGSRRMSHRAFLGALMTFLYRSEPTLNHPYSVLKLLMDIETAVWQWRTVHVMMVHRMIGSKMGTAGSSGVGYLKATVSGDRYRVFTDLFNVASFLVPAEYIPPLPHALKRRLAFPGNHNQA